MKKLVKKLNPKTDKDYENLGRMLASIYETGYIDRSQSYKHSFFKGVLGGLGGVIGATIVVTLFIWFMSLFSQVPLIGYFIHQVQNSIDLHR